MNPIYVQVVEVVPHPCEDIADAQNALCHAIVDAIKYAQNANGQLITSQHNVLRNWLKEMLCMIYEQVNGACVDVEEFIGPLKEDQAFIPVELSWPEGQPTMAERLDAVEGKVDAIESSMKEMKKMMSKLLDAVAKE